MLDKECVVGAKVIFVNKDPQFRCYFGKQGIISSVSISRNRISYYYVKDDKNNLIGPAWIKLSSWDIYQEIKLTTIDCPNWVVSRTKECPCGINRKDCTYHA